jgi:hypothetical protein
MRCDATGTPTCGVPGLPGRTLGSADSQETAVDNGTDTAMTELHEHYARRVDAAVAEGRMDLVQELYGDYLDEALRRLLATTAAA